MLNLYKGVVHASHIAVVFCLQLLAVFMQLGARELLMHYMDLKQTNDVQLTFEALKVTHSLHVIIYQTPA